MPCLTSKCCPQQLLKHLLRVGGRPVAFRPAHEQKLANEFMLYTDSEAVAEALGGWDEGKGKEPASIRERE